MNRPYHNIKLSSQKRCRRCTMTEVMHRKWPKNTCQNFTESDIYMTEEKSDLKQLADEIREINRDNGWNIWKRDDIRSNLPDTLRSLYDEVNEKINTYKMEKINPPSYILYMRDDLESVANRIAYKFPTIISLIHSEATEALEWFRQLDKRGVVVNDKIMNSEKFVTEIAGLSIEDIKKDSDIDGPDHFTIHLNRVESDEDIIELIKEEMADILIRVLDWWSAYDDDPIDIIKKKLDKNRSRENRHGGKVV